MSVVQPTANFAIVADPLSRDLLSDTPAPNSLALSPASDTPVAHDGLAGTRWAFGPAAVILTDAAIRSTAAATGATALGVMPGAAAARSRAPDLGLDLDRPKTPDQRAQEFVALYMGRLDHLLKADVARWGGAAGFNKKLAADLQAMAYHNKLEQDRHSKGGSPQFFDPNEISNRIARSGRTIPAEAMPILQQIAEAIPANARAISSVSVDASLPLTGPTVLPDPTEEHGAGDDIVAWAWIGPYAEEGTAQPPPDCEPGNGADATAASNGHDLSAARSHPRFEPVTLAEIRRERKMLAMRVKSLALRWSDATRAHLLPEANAVRQALLKNYSALERLAANTPGFPAHIDVINRTGAMISADPANTTQFMFGRSTNFTILPETAYGFTNPSKAALGVNSATRELGQLIRTFNEKIGGFDAPASLPRGDPYIASFDLEQVARQISHETCGSPGTSLIRVITDML